LLNHSSAISNERDIEVIAEMSRLSGSWPSK